MGFINLNKNPFRYCANLVNKLENNKRTSTIICKINAIIASNKF